MKLCTLREGTRDGSLFVVSRDGERCVSAGEIAPSLQAALDRWELAAPRLHELSGALNAGSVSSEPFPRDARVGSPLPRSFEWVDASAYLNHIILVRKARGALPPENLKTSPLVYQGGSGTFLGPRDPIPLVDPAWGLDFEAEVCVILGDVPIGTTEAQAADCIRLVMLANDVTLRNLVPDELAKGFGFFQSKPSTAFSPMAVTPDELGDAWKGGRLHLRLRTLLNGVLVGDPEAGPEMHFSFFELIAHIAKTRSFTAGTILGGGTVSNADRARGVSCLAERRTLETIENGHPTTPFLAATDRVQIEMLNGAGNSIFGRIDQTVARVTSP
jgi:fumarylacetoacetate (FAA) hydrolase